MRSEPIVNDAYYHVYNRGVDRQKTYLDNHDHERFLRGMIAFNDTGHQRVNLSRLRSRPARSSNPLVSIMCYALMPNHYHFLLRQLVDNGIAIFMHRIGMSFAKYFNNENARDGHLWESKYKAVRIETDPQLLHISRYIHLNPLKLFLPDWKIRGVENWNTANAFLEAYPWSSYRHYLGLINDAAVDMDILDDLFSDPEDYRNFLRDWVCVTPSVAHQRLNVGMSRRNQSKSVLSVMGSSPM